MLAPVALDQPSRFLCVEVLSFYSYPILIIKPCGYHITCGKVGVMVTTLKRVWETLAVAMVGRARVWTTEMAGEVVGAG